MASRRLTWLSFILLLAAWQACLSLAAKVPAKASTTVDEAADSYIIVLTPGTGPEYVKAMCSEAESPWGRFSGACQHQFLQGLVGFAGAFTAGDLAKLQGAYGDVVENVERDATIAITGAAAAEWAAQDAPPFAQPSEDRDLRLHAVESAQAEIRRRRELAEQLNPGWNLDRMDQRTASLDHKYHYNATGTGVSVYVLDTGIRATHEEFRVLLGSDNSTRVQAGFSVFGDNNTSDCNGHGTHTAATVGGLSYGVAKNVTLWPVRAMNCQGGSTVSYLLKALEWVAENHQDPAILSMSVAGDLSLAVNEAVRRLVETHMITVVVAAGNGYSPACEVSPASVPSAITVGASDAYDRRWAKSNWGPCVDIHAPGVDVLSATSFKNVGGLAKSGTSMACPHVAGVVALYLEQHPGASPSEIRSKLNSAAEAVLRDDVEGYGTFSPADNPQSLDVSSTPNRLVYAILPSQATFLPQIVRIGVSRQPVSLAFRLEAQPQSIVNVTATVPSASWTNAKLATLEPNIFALEPGSWAQPQQLALIPSILANGDYSITFTFSSLDANYSNMLQTVKVVDTRPLTGDTLQNPRIVSRLPFVDTDDSSRFSDNYALDNGDPDGSTAADVCYFFKPSVTVDVDISTCGSSIDTKLYMFQDPINLKVYTSNDDDAMCASNNRNSRISTRLQAGQGYYIVVDGYSSGWTTAEGLYQLSITERSGAHITAMP